MKHFRTLFCLTLLLSLPALAAPSAWAPRTVPALSAPAALRAPAGLVSAIRTAPGYLAQAHLLAGTRPLFAAVTAPGSSGGVLALLGKVAAILLKTFGAGAIVWLTGKAKALLKAHEDKAVANHHMAKLAEAEYSLGNWALVGVQDIYPQVQKDLDAGRPIGDIARDAAEAGKRYVTTTGLDELGSLLGISASGVGLRLQAAATNHVMAIAATKATGGANPQPLTVGVPDSPPVPAAG